MVPCKPIELFKKEEDILPKSNNDNIDITVVRTQKPRQKHKTGLNDQLHELIRKQ
jgi:hypothetical protein